MQQHPWDVAHAFSRAASEQAQSVYTEPDLLQVFESSFPSPAIGSDDPDTHWPPSSNAPVDWHLDDDHSQLKTARGLVVDPGSARRVRIGHLDTGFSQHETRPQHLLDKLGYNFVEDNDCAIDPADYSGTLDNPGHGTYTLALLAGARCSLTGDFLGGAPFADVVPVRITNSVVHFWTSAIADGISWALSRNCDLVSMSMGGVPLQCWADWVNEAYHAGCTIFAAAGNSYGGLPTRYTIYPARFQRTVSVCGVTFDYKPYFREEYELQKVMEGNFGPDDAMKMALASYTPNLLSAQITNKTNAYRRDGAGTSGATPQAAAAGALYFQKNLDALLSLEGWQRVEAVRHALFSTAKPGASSLFGHGLLRAADALQKPITTGLEKMPEDTIDFALLKELFGWDALRSESQRMLALEAVQLVTASGTLREKVGKADVNTTGLSISERQEIVNALIGYRAASQTLKTFLLEARLKM